MEPFKGTDIPVIYGYAYFDEVAFSGVGEYKGFKFLNVESAQDEIQKLTKDKKKQKAEGQESLPEDEFTPFCLWLKNEL